MLATELGEGFEAAPPDPATQADDFDELLGLIDRLYSEAPVAMLGPAPDEGKEGRRTWDELAETVNALVRGNLQAAVRGALS